MSFIAAYMAADIAGTILGLLILIGSVGWTVLTTEPASEDTEA